MIAIAIETSEAIGSIAIARDGQVLAEREFEHGLRHAAEMVPVLDALTRQYQIEPRQVDEIYVSAGPGSFTGLRIGITLAKTFAFATGARIVAVPTVRVLAENAPAEAKRLIIVLDAKRGQIFTARFSRENSSLSSPGTPVCGEPSRTGEGRGEGQSEISNFKPRDHWQQEEPAHLDTLAAMLARAPRPVHLLGQGIAYHRQEIPDDPQVIVTDESHWRARASAVGNIGRRMATQNKFTPMDQLLPIYLRKPEAEEKWEARQ